MTAFEAYETMKSVYSKLSYADQLDFMGKANILLIEEMTQNASLRQVISLPLGFEVSREALEQVKLSELCQTRLTVLIQKFRLKTV